MTEEFFNKIRLRVFTRRGEVLLLKQRIGYGLPELPVSIYSFNINKIEDNNELKELIAKRMKELGIKYEHQPIEVNRKIIAIDNRSNDDSETEKYKKLLYQTVFIDLRDQFEKTEEHERLLKEGDIIWGSVRFGKPNYAYPMVDKYSREILRQKSSTLDSILRELSAPLFLLPFFHRIFAAFEMCLLIPLLTYLKPREIF